MKFIKYILAPFIMASLLTSAVVAPSQAADPPKVMIVGDSMTSLYNDVPGSSQQGWWSMVARAKGWTPVTDAEYGSGFLRRGFGTTNNSGSACTGTILKERIAKIAQEDPDYLIIAAGRNDLKKCVNGVPVAATTTESVNAAKAYFAALKTEITNAGIPISRVYVMVPWAYSQTQESTVLRPKIRDAAKAQGFTWILTWALSQSETNSDGLHQNLAGNKSLRDDVLAGL